MSNLKQNFFKVQSFYFRMMGFDMFEVKLSWRQPWRTLWSLPALCFMQLMIIAFAIQNLEDIEKLTDALTAMIINSLAMFKLGLMIWLHKEFAEIIYRFRKILDKECRYEVPALIIAQENEREQRISGIYKNCFLLAGILSFLKPILRLVVVYLTNGQLSLVINVPSRYPWDNEKPLNFCIALVVLFGGSYCVVLSTICIDTLFLSLTHNLVALFKTAQHKMQFFRGETDMETKDRLRRVLDLYKDSLDMSTTLKRHFRLLITAQLVMASVHLCVLSYTVSHSFGQAQMPFYIVFILSILAQVYIYCHCGEYLKAQSRQFAWAIYDSPWYESRVVTPWIGQCLRFSMMRAQRGCYIDGYFFEANMEVFLSIVMTAMSYLTLLRSIS